MKKIIKTGGKEMKQLVKILAIGVFGALIFSGCAGSNSTIDRYSNLLESHKIPKPTAELDEYWASFNPQTGFQSDFLTKDKIILKGSVSKSQLLNELENIIKESEYDIKRFGTMWEKDKRCYSNRGWSDINKYDYYYGREGQRPVEVMTFGINSKKGESGIFINCEETTGGSHTEYSIGGNKRFVYDRKFAFNSKISFNPNYNENGEASEIDVYINFDCTNNFDRKNNIYCNEKEGDVADEFLRMYTTIRDRIQIRDFKQVERINNIKEDARKRQKTEKNEYYNIQKEKGLL